MYPFEVWDERTNRIEFYWDRWFDYREHLFNQYPVQANHQRLEISLHFPSDRLQDIPTHWNPHHTIGNYHLSPYDYFYDSNNWSTIFEVYPEHNHNGESIRMFVEEGHQDPWGGPIRILSMASHIGNDSSIRFAYFRGKYWKIISWRNHSERSWFERFVTSLPTIYNSYLAATQSDYIILDFYFDFSDDIAPKPITYSWEKEGF